MAWFVDSREQAARLVRTVASHVGVAGIGAALGIQVVMSHVIPEACGPGPYMTVGGCAAPLVSIANSQIETYLWGGMACLAIAIGAEFYGGEW